MERVYITPEQYEIAEKNGISRRTVYQRVYFYEPPWSVERAITEPKNQKTKYGKWLKVAAENGIRISTFYQRICVYGMSPEKAATKPLQTREEKRANTLKYHRENRKFPAWAYEMAEKNGISFSRLNNRVRAGWSLEDAATTPIIKDMRARREFRKGYGY